MTSSRPVEVAAAHAEERELRKRVELDCDAALVAALGALRGLETRLDDERDASVERQLGARAHEPDAPRGLAVERRRPIVDRRPICRPTEIDEHALARQPDVLRQLAQLAIGLHLDRDARPRRRDA